MATGNNRLDFDGNLIEDLLNKYAKIYLGNITIIKAPRIYCAQLFALHDNNYLFS